MRVTVDGTVIWEGPLTYSINKIIKPDVLWNNYNLNEIEKF